MTQTRLTRDILLAALVLCTLTSTFQLAQSQGAESAINQASNTLASTCQAAAQAQAAGANVDGLMTTLNEAADLLSKAQLANAAGDYSAANNYASQCQSKITGVTAEASRLQQEALNQKSQSTTFTVLNLLVSVAVLFSGVVAWFVLNKRERRSTDGAKSL